MLPVGAGAVTVGVSEWSPILKGDNWGAKPGPPARGRGWSHLLGWGGRFLAVGMRGRWSGRAKPSLSWEDLGHQLPPWPPGAPWHVPLPGVLPSGCFTGVSPCMALGCPGTCHPEVLCAGHSAGQRLGLADLGGPQGPGTSPNPQREPWRDAASSRSPGGSLLAPPRAG